MDTRVNQGWRVPLLLALIAIACGGTEEGGGAASVDSARSDALETTAACFESTYPQYPLTAVEFRIDDTRVTDEEHCMLAQSYLSDLKGRQIRVMGNDRMGLCTVEETGHSFGGGVVLLSTTGFTNKFGPEEGSPLPGEWSTEETTPVDTCGWVTEQLASVTSTPSTDVRIGEFFRPSGSFAPARVSFTAPHGGGIEPGTDDQVAHLYNRYSAYATTQFWAVLGDSDESHERWHVSSLELSKESFSGLNRLAARFSGTDTIPDQVVSFHGHADADCKDVMIGGAVPLVFRQGVEKALELWGDYRNVSYTTGTTFSTDCEKDGDDADNFVNTWSDRGEGLQLEQSRSLRDNTARRNAVAEAVGSYVMAYNVPMLYSPGATPSQVQFQDYGFFGGAWRVAHNVRVTSDATYGDCLLSGDRGYVDWFAREGSTLRRIGGGPLVCNTSSKKFVPASTGFQPVSYLNSTGAEVRARVVVVAFTDSTSGSYVRLGARLLK